MRLETHPHSHRKNAATEGSSNAKEIKGERPSPNTKIVKVEGGEDDSIDSYSEHVYGAQTNKRPNARQHRDLPTMRSLDVKVEGGSKQTTPPSLKQQIAAANSQKADRGGDGESGFVDSRSRGYGSQNRYRPSSSGGGSYLDYTDVDNMGDDEADLAAAAADAAAAEKARERAERRARQKKRQEAREKRGKLHDNMESRYYRASDGTLKKLGAEPDYLESMMEQGLPIKQWLVICALLGACAYQLWKTISGSMKSAGSSKYAINKKSADNHGGGLVMKKKGKKQKGRKSGGSSKRNLSSSFEGKDRSISVTKPHEKEGAPSSDTKEVATKEIETEEEANQQPETTKAEPSAKKKRKKTKKPKATAVASSKNGEKDKDAAPSKNGEKDNDVAPSKNGEKDNDVAPSKNGEKDKDVAPSKNVEKDKDVAPSKNGEKDKDIAPSKNGEKDKDVTPLEDGKEDKESQSPPPNLLTEEPSPTEDMQPPKDEKPDQPKPDTIEGETKLDLNSYNEDDRRAIMMVLTDADVSDEGEWKSVRNSARDRKAERQKWKQSRQQQESNGKKVGQKQLSAGTSSADKVETPSASSVGAPSADKSESSSAGKAGTPSADNIESSLADKAATTPANKAETPSTDVAETLSAEKSEKPSAISAATSSDDKTATSSADSDDLKTESSSKNIASSSEKTSQSAGPEANTPAQPSKADAEASKEINKNGDSSKGNHKLTNGENDSDKATNSVASPTVTTATPSTIDDAELARKLQLEEEKVAALEGRQVEDEDEGWETVTARKKRSR